MLVTASTIKDSAANVRFFVEANLASGVDHLLVFLDAPAGDGQDDVAAFLDAHPHATCIRAGGPGWWHGERPASLNVRQRINANWALELLSPLGWASWLFHVDGDEVALVDRAALAALGPSVSAVRLTPLEAVARTRAEGRPTQFKRLLDEDDLTLLHVLGTIDEPSNQAYFHGHVMGKSGVRVGAGLALTLHDAVSPDGERREGHAGDEFRLLHYDALSEDEFIRKWTALASAGPARYRSSRRAAARALKSLVQRDLSPQVRRKYLSRIYAHLIADDVETLDELGMLVQVDAVRGGHRPAGLDAAQQEELATRVAALRDADKSGFLVADAAKDGPRSPGEPPQRKRRSLLRQRASRPT